MMDTLTTLAWRPFIDPISGIAEVWWVLLIPLAFGIAVAYKAVRLQTMERYWWHVGLMTTQIVIAIILLAVATYLFVEVYVRTMAQWA